MGSTQVWPERPLIAAYSLPVMIPSYISANEGAEPSTTLQPLLVTEPEACRILGIGRTTIFHLRREGRLRSVLVKTHKHNVSGRRMYRLSDLNAYVEALALSTE